ncbi:hypothetical protein [Comamonas sp. JUb58]|uniref:hypothetical protein n=1 Tax=Comamonas sp. JUb58 TaxID=2485114 RepID=UPI001060D810|nr:hypothetical protein [Comamonas sp. JUb58]TDS82086.1 hypothetical protein EDF71_1082 [Comamonas sp. JUb58]
MKVWEIYGEGEGFVVDGTEMAFEVSGFIEADDSNAAFAQACELAKREHPELAQAAGPFPRPEINAMEIQEIGADLAVEVGTVQVD